MCECWYHAELSQAYAEQLLIRDGRDGAFLVRQSESVSGAFAICLMNLHQVHTYRVLPDENGLLSVQSVQGVKVEKFPGLRELIANYRYKGHGLVTALHYPVGRQGVAKVGDHIGKDIIFTDAYGLSYCDGPCRTNNTTLQETQQAERKQCLGQHALMEELKKTCKNLDREIKDTWHSLKILAQVFRHTSMILLPKGDQVSILDSLICSISCVLQLLSTLESKARQACNESISGSSSTLATQNSPGINICRAKESQHIRQSDQVHLQRTSPQSLSIFVGTWNMVLFLHSPMLGMNVADHQINVCSSGGSSPPRSLSSWLSIRKIEKNLGNPSGWMSHDLYMIGTQENPQGDREWAEFLRTALISQTMKQYKLVCVHSIGGIKLALLVREEYEHLISHVQTSTVRTGISNTLGIRGAVGVSFNFNRVSLGFVTSHLVSGIEKVQKRNQSFGEILRGLTLGDETLRSFQLPLRLTYLFWAGDLNYKIDMPFQDVLQRIYSGQHQTLLPMDQLNQEREKKKTFLGFKEHPITFPPTCRYERGSRTYDLQKARTTGTRIFAPSWSDRILWTSYPDTEVKCTSYGCTDDIVTSDHSPVFSTFEVGLNALSPRDCSYNLKFLGIEAIIKTQNRSKGYIEFQSLCLKGTAQSRVNSMHSSEGAAFVKLGWLEQDLPELTLIEDLTQSTCSGHLLLSIRPADGGESYGECCVSLRTEYVNTENHIQVFLSQRGEETGSLRGRMRMNHLPVVNPARSSNMAGKETEKGDSTVVMPKSSADTLCGHSRLSRRPTRSTLHSFYTQDPFNSSHFISSHHQERGRIYTIITSYTLGRSLIGYLDFLIYIFSICFEKTLFTCYNSYSCC
ncbi:phosphatidylinositol 3,4,5-trisphosphate 5-phosphatase 2A-like isoform X2 [Bufo gargarizans]|uniref:phosphatidylinositol 3,4,5-trisphosphate 5-phosphatase 2A-like isoform X2 n=1 Tax=Bufo gargarizans TaxID=30331 RepID=UPI001CF29AD1|nr:phosphatidylinositol 3,4,5-trisphosphate 5-phosphatase 2A-like isoform X2 [Bufo gargarizans]